MQYCPGVKKPEPMIGITVPGAVEDRLEQVGTLAPPAQDTEYWIVEWRFPASNVMPAGAWQAVDRPPFRTELAAKSYPQRKGYYEYRISQFAKARVAGEAQGEAALGTCDFSKVPHERHKFCNDFVDAGAHPAPEPDGPTMEEHRDGQRDRDAHQSADSEDQPPAMACRYIGSGSHPAHAVESSITTEPDEISHDEARTLVRIRVADDNAYLRLCQYIEQQRAAHPESRGAAESALRTEPKFTEKELGEHAVQLGAIGMCGINQDLWKTRREIDMYVEKHFLPKRAATPSSPGAPQTCPSCEERRNKYAWSAAFLCNDPWHLRSPVADTEEGPELSVRPPAHLRSRRNERSDARNC